ncbi:MULTISPECIES: transporter substrate-binding domain-containing protein [unclassified Mesorhizobium]|uniref:transporter substrate-binding domain-containing protein n=1 Tax=unclassified Mesorhizobium TaxID=325217 RepID=UPI000FCC5D5E|nr:MULTISPECIES: transporter substrate-binding domain-containing protein [unclassified Mesorhizobium]RUU68239.1 transporter substrate-binding domain-containing protein [Mesorhizobium sp. M7A.T.Ca.TU.009.01.1.1]RUU90716.1 transporter substrate-binding domain-containing protein [Mesorhizobium sp. M7A.T.Ca.TU.009.01.1.2]RUX07940.1 transporter substrate-binding domain-containing protein [Mesorhizobium sp. M8A.F.Ca.ET.023.01.1.1]RVD59563.1 transporter substrate-binding domain-containing protein [Mes
MKTKMGTAILAAGISLFAGAYTVTAGPLSDRISAGQPIRIGFSNVPIYAFPDDKGQPKGFVNDVALGILKDMGLTNFETTVTDWGGLIPGLQANRYDIITGGMYILGSRCKNVAFSEPIAKTGDAFLVPAGNPKGIHNYKDILQKNAAFVTYSGANLIEAAKKEGVSDDQITQVPGPSEVLAAVKSGRADAGGMTYFEVKSMADGSNGQFEATNPADLPEWTQNWVGIGFRTEDADFLAKFNEALKRYVGTPRMIEAIKPYGLSEVNLPGPTTTQWACSNR